MSERKLSPQELSIIRADRYPAVIDDNGREWWANELDRNYATITTLRAQVAAHADEIARAVAAERAVWMACATYNEIDGLRVYRGWNVSALSKLRVAEEERHIAAIRARSDKP